MIRRIHQSPLAKNSLTYLIANTINAAIPFLLLPVLTRALGPVQYGQVAMFQMIVSALAALTGLCVQSAANRKFYDADARDELPAFIAACFQILSVSSVVLFCIALAFQGPVAAWSGLSVGWVLCAVVVSAANVVINLRLGQWQVRREARKYATFQVTQSAMLMALALALVLAWHMGAGGRIWAQVLVATSFAALAGVALWRDGLIRPGWRPDLVREALAFGVPLVPHVAGVFILGTVDRAVVNEHLGLEAVGAYTVGVQVAMILAIVFDAVNKAYVPWLFERLARGRDHELARVVRMTWIYCALALLAAAVVATIGGPVIRLLAGPGFEAAAPVVGWLALGQAFSGMYLMVTNYVQFARRTGALATVTVCAGALNIALLLWLVPRDGIRGAAIAFATAMAVRFIATWWLAQRVHPMPWFRALSPRPPAG